jgi:hypothetical protein
VPHAQGKDNDDKTKKKEEEEGKEGGKEGEEATTTTGAAAVASVSAALAALSLSEEGEEEEGGREEGEEAEEEELDVPDGSVEPASVAEEEGREAAAEQAWEATAQTKALWQPRVSTAASTPSSLHSSSSLPPSSSLSEEMRQALLRKVSPTGRVVCVIEPKHQTDLVGRLKLRTPVKDGQPLSQKVGFFRLLPPSLPPFTQQLF